MIAMPRQFKTFFATSILLLGLSACTTVRPPERRDATAGLLAHPQFKDAVRAAPKWVSDALTIITNYEAELARR